jgi:group I intron endonuclease
MIIYKVTNTLNNKVYIGKTKQSLSKRKAAHYKRVNEDSPTNFHNSLRKYPKNTFIWEVEIECENLSELNEYEIHYIKEYNSYVSGYNMTEGGDGGFTYKRGDDVYERIKDKLGKWENGNPGATKEAIEKRLESFKKVTWPNGKNHKNYGHRHNVGILVGERNPMYGKTPSNARKVQIDGVIYDSIAKASRELSINQTTIVDRCKNNNITSYNFIK